MQDYLNKDVDGGVWLSAVEEYAVDTPEFYPSAFGRILDHYLRSTYGIIDIKWGTLPACTDKSRMILSLYKFVNINNY